MSNEDSSSAAQVDVINPSEQNFVPRPFGGPASFQIVLNTTSFASVLGQLQEVYNASQAQLSSPFLDASISLVETGCFSNTTSPSAGDGLARRNCTQACATPSQMFNSSFTFWNCLTLGAASLYTAQGSLLLDPGGLADAGGGLGFDSLDQFNGTQIFQDTVNCIKGSCQDYSLGSCTTNISTIDIHSLTNSADPVAALFEGLQGYCAGASSIVNSDIAGPGVRFPPLLVVEDGASF